MMPGFVKVDSFIFYEDIWPRIKDDVEVIANTRYDTKKGGHTIIIKWGFRAILKKRSSSPSSESMLRERSIG